MKRLRHLILAGLFSTLAGCAGFGSHETVDDQGNSQSWQEHKQQLSALDAWQINGKVGIRAPKDSGSATLFWLQRQDYYDIRLSGPLGGGVARLMGHPGKISLEVSNQGTYEADTPEQLLREQLRLNLPVSHLLWWVRGLPSPDTKSQLQLDSHSRLAQLSQDGWNIEYISYTEQNGYWLPERLKVSGPDLQITLVIKDWQPRQLAQ